MRRRIWTAANSGVGMEPEPPHVGQSRWVRSRRDCLMRCRLISSSPFSLMRLRYTRALSCLKAALRVFSTSRLLLRAGMSMKSTTSNPPRSRSRSSRAMTRAASTLVFSAVSSWLLPLVDLPLLTSMAVRASVGSMTMLPPDGRRTLRRWIASSCSSTLWWVNRGTRPECKVILPLVRGMTAVK